MASEISWRHTATGKTVYATIRSAGRQMWSTVGAALENLTVANWANYDIALAETPANSYFYVGTWPAALSTVGWYWVDIYYQDGVNPAIDDEFLGTIVGYWDSTSLLPWASDLTEATITATTFDGSTAFPVAQEDTGVSALARVGNDGDTLETLSDQIDATALDANLSNGTVTLNAAYDAAKTAAQAGDEMDLIDAPNGTAVAAIADAIWAEALEGALTAAEIQKIILAVLAGKSSSAGTPTHVKFRDQADTKDRVDATMTGSSRTAVSVDGG